MDALHPSRLSRFLAESRALAALTWPILGAQLAHASMGFVDTVMTGRFAPLDLAAVAIGSSIWFPLFLFMLGILLAVTPTVAQMHGRGETTAIGQHVRQALWVALLVAFPVAVLLPFARPILLWMAVDPPAIPLTIAYLEGIRWGLPAIAIFFVLRHFSEGLGFTAPSLLVGLVGLAFNIVANYVLIFGHFGFPALGGVGCGYATGMTMWVMMLCMLGIILTRRVYRAAAVFSCWPRPERTEILQILSLGVPIGFSLFIEASIFAVIALLIGSLGAEIVAAHQITLNFASLVFMVPLSFSHAITVRVGWAIGRLEFSQARFSSFAGIALTFVIALVTANLTWFFPHLIARIYSDNLQLLTLASELLALGALFQVSDAVQVCASGALRGYKDTRIPMQLLVIAYWVIGLPLGYSLALSDFWRPAMGAAGFWIGLIAGLTAAAILLGLRLIRLSQKHIEQPSPPAI